MLSSTCLKLSIPQISLSHLFPCLHSSLHSTCSNLPHLIFICVVLVLPVFVSSIPLFSKSPLLSLMKVKMLVDQSCPTLPSHGLYPTRLLCPWNSPGKNTGVVLFPSPGGFSTQGLNPGLQHCGQILYHLNHQESQYK